MLACRRPRGFAAGPRRSFLDRELQPGKVVATARLLHTRVAERFPGSGLARIATELADLAEHAAPARG